jgi:hypothetical protein
VRWYGPKALTQTGLRDFISRVIGGYADQRILQAAVDRPDAEELVSRYDYTIPGFELAEVQGGVWVDYVADMGDGFSSTYAMAQLISDDQVEVEIGGKLVGLPAAELLVMGGDQAYPYASKEEYEKRLRQPYEIAIWHSPASERGERHVFVLPGNHDWYDGLSAFDRLFCSRRDGLSKATEIGRYRCRQHRSYWAIKLPHDWWIWGLDTQLTASLDAGQMQYFAAIKETLPESRTQAKIILCIAEPAWLKGAESGSFQDYAENLQQILNVAIDRATVVCVISGDWHHYARYFSPEHRLNLITSGGGGAYLAPTHHLPSTIPVPWKLTEEMSDRKVKFHLNAPTSTDTATVQNAAHEPRPGAVYPRKAVSRGLTNRILAFPFTNLTFCLTLGFIYMVMYWFYSSVEVGLLEDHGRKLLSREVLDTLRPEAQAQLLVARRRIEMDTLLLHGPRVLWPWEHVYYLFQASRWQPALAVTVLFVLGLIFQFFVHSKNIWKRTIVSVGFWLIHLLAMAYLSHLLLRYALNQPLIGEGMRRIVFTTASMWIGGGLIAGTLCGLYLWIATKYSQAHADVGFSSVHIPGYNNFLRMHITEHELKIYPIALERVPGQQTGWREVKPEEGLRGGYAPKKPLAPQLIEGPVIIRPTDIIQMMPRQAPPPQDPVDEQKHKPQTAV